MNELVGNESLLVKQLEELAVQGTPFYWYDANEFRSRYSLLKNSLPQNFNIFYSVKANPNLSVLNLFRNAGARAEAASEGEMYLALRAGFHPKDIIFTCPGKTDEAIRFAIRNRIYCIHIESPDEAERVNAIATSELSGKVNIAVRVNPNGMSGGNGPIMSGKQAHFGIEEQELNDFFECVAKKYERLSLIGIHVYAATQILDAAAILSNMAQIFALAEKTAIARNQPWEFIDLGGGFGVPYADDHEELDMHQLKKGLEEIWAGYAPVLGNATVAVESGRFLTASGGELITKVLSVKKSGSAKFIICDGGYAQHPASFYIGRHGRNRFPIKTLSASGAAEELVTITGPTGTPVDKLAENILLPPVKIGDLLRVTHSGAYGYTNSCQLFFSSPSPAEWMLEDSEFTLLRERGIPEAIAGQMIFENKQKPV